jgi:hypothetical protein
MSCCPALATMLSWSFIFRRRGREMSRRAMFGRWLRRYVYNMGLECWVAPEKPFCVLEQDSTSNYLRGAQEELQKCANIYQGSSDDVS